MRTNAQTQSIGRAIEVSFDSQSRGQRISCLNGSVNRLMFKLCFLGLSRRLFTVNTGQLNAFFQGAMQEPEQLQHRLIVCGPSYREMKPDICWRAIGVVFDRLGHLVQGQAHLDQVFICTAQSCQLSARLLDMKTYFIGISKQRLVSSHACAEPKARC